jgi:hypothetical protein
MPDMTNYRVEKQGYSAGPWRVLYTANGEQVYRREVFDHPQLGRINIAGPVCFDRKRDAVAWIAAQDANQGEHKDA